VAQSATLLIRLANEGKNKFHINSKNETKIFLLIFIQPLSDYDIFKDLKEIFLKPCSSLIFKISLNIFRNSKSYENSK